MAAQVGGHEAAEARKVIATLLGEHLGQVEPAQEHARAAVAILGDVQRDRMNLALNRPTQD